jgi:hypothetical protein
MAEHDAAGATELRLHLLGALAANLSWITVVGIATPTISSLLILSDPCGDAAEHRGSVSPIPLGEPYGEQFRLGAPGGHTCRARFT